MNEQPHELELERIQKRDRVREMGLNPYGSRTDGLVTLQEAHEKYDEQIDAECSQAGIKSCAQGDRRPVVLVAGRVMLARDNGKLIWMNLRDSSRDSLQIAISKRDCDELGFDLAKLTDLGDLVIALGPLTRTRTGEVTVWVSSLRPASKCLLPPPEKHAGLTDPEMRYRQRYVDMWANPRTIRTLELRSRIIASIRRLMDERGFLEVETPMLQTQAGGAAARPFRTHMNALDIEMFLRIAPELYLKRLLVGGMTRVYEINRNFRNEGVDRQHNPEFTAIEVYQAYANVDTMMELTEAIIRNAAAVARDFIGAKDPILPFGDLNINYDAPFDRITYAELFERGLGFSMDDTARARLEAEKRGISIRSDDGAALDDLWVANELFERVAEPLIDSSRPTWVMRYPALLSPLTRPCEDDDRFADRSDLFIAGMEIGPHYTELNDPEIQARRFREQLAGIDAEESTFRSYDEDFVRAIKVGMPPAGGMGLGIDRIVMLMSGQQTIRDVIAFPLMKPL